ncbi:MAG: hypothetical protein ACK4GJ_06080 [bacterium]
MQKEKEILKNSFKECEKHKAIITYSLKKLKKILPLDASKYQKLTKNQKLTLDSLLFRFAKLQDTLGNKIIRNALKILAEDIENLSFIDILNKAEKIGLIDNVDKWLELRYIRNEISHEYEEDYRILAEKLNNFFEAVILLLKTYENIKKFCDAKIFGYSFKRKNVNK